MIFPRRTFLSLTASAVAAGIASPKFFAQSGTGHAKTLVRVSGEALATMPLDFAGLSYESPQLYNPSYFSKENVSLVAAVKHLSPHGVVRFGGNLSDVARWKSDAGDFMTPKLAAAIEHGKTYWEWKLTDPRVRADRGGAITPKAIRALRGFLDATGWKAIYGLNFGSGSPERARDEAVHVATMLGEKLIAFQVGNEADFFGDNPFFRDKAYDFEEYYSGYQTFVRAVRDAVPHAPFAGPDTAANMEWVELYAKRAAGDAVMLSSHYYAMGPAKDPAMNAARLLRPSPHLDNQIVQAHQATTASGGKPFRLTETNSCYGGGRPDVSDAFASALWGADMMLETAGAGYAGVNLHGGGDGYYTPIAVGGDGRAELRPLFYGMQFAQLLSGTQLFKCDATSDANLTAYAGRKGKALLLALINKGPEAVDVSLDWPELRGRTMTRAYRLTAPALESKSGVSISPVVVAPRLASNIAGTRAMVFAWS